MPSMQIVLKMFSLKFSFLLTFLVNISIIHFTFATEYMLCQGYIMREGQFNNVKHGGLQNFQYAFKSLTEDIIDFKFRQLRTPETDKKQYERLLSRKLVKSYFNNLSNHGINFDNVENGIDWCTREVFSSEGIDPTNLLEWNNALIESKFHECLDSIGLLLVYESDIYSTATIFQRLYDNWVETGVESLNADQGQTSADQGQTSQDQGQTSADRGQTSEELPDDYSVIEEFIDELLERPLERVPDPKLPKNPFYAKKYYRYIIEFVDKLDPTKGTFPSIKDYCFVTGQVIIKNFEL